MGDLKPSGGGVFGAGLGQSPSAADDWDVKTSVDAEPDPDAIETLQRKPYVSATERAAYLLRARIAQRASLADEDLTGVDLSGLDLSGFDLRRTILRGAILRGTIFRRAVLHDAVLAGAHLDGAGFFGAQLTAADLTGAVGCQVDWRESDLGRAVFDGATLLECLFDRCRGAATRWVGAVLTGSRFVDARLDGADLGEACLDDVCLEGASLVGARLHGAHGMRVVAGACDLTRARALGGAAFPEADLTRALLDDGVWSGAVLVGAKLLSASLRRVDFTGADLRGARSEGCRSEGADLAGALLDDVESEMRTLQRPAVRLP